MSKFHDEFFRQGSPVHDKLMIKCLSKDGIDKIVNITTTEFNFAINTQHEYEIPDAVWICSNAVGRTARKDDDKLRPVIGTTSVYGDPIKPYIHTGDRRACNFEETCEYAKTCKWLLEGKKIERVNVVRNFTATPVKSEYETEVIVKNGHFILGYADAVISTTYNVVSDAIIDPEWTWKNYATYPMVGRTIVEVKPKITSIGDTIRQIKTYHDGLLHRYHEYVGPFMCIATYDQLDQDELDYLANEHIHVVVLPEVR